MTTRILIGNIDGEQGPAGAGFPEGGLIGQGLVKKTDTNFDTEWAYPTKTLILEVAGDLAVGTTKAFVPIPFDMEITKVKAHVLTAPTGADLIIDINVNGTSIYTTQANRPTIASGNTFVEADLPDSLSISENDMVTIDIDQVGSTIAGSNLAVVITCDAVAN